MFAKTLVNGNLSFLIKSSLVLQNYTEKKNKQFGFEAYGNELMNIRDKIDKDLKVTHDETNKIDKFIEIITNDDFNKIYFINKNYSNIFERCWELLNILATRHYDIVVDIIYNSPTKKLNSDPNLRNFKNIKILDFIKKLNNTNKFDNLLFEELKKKFNYDTELDLLTISSILLYFVTQKESINYFLYEFLSATYKYLKQTHEIDKNYEIEDLCSINSSTSVLQTNLNLNNLKKIIDLKAIRDSLAHNEFTITKNEQYILNFRSGFIKEQYSLTLTAAQLIELYRNYIKIKEINACIFRMCFLKSILLKFFST